MIIRRPALPVLSAVVLTWCCAACGNPPTALVQIHDDGPVGASFDPASLVVDPGTEVRWQNEGAWSHPIATGADLVAGEPAVPDGFDPWQETVVRPGAAFSQTLTVEGDYLYWTEAEDGTRNFGTIRVESR